MLPFPALYSSSKQEKLHPFFFFSARRKLLFYEDALPLKLYILGFRSIKLTMLLA